MKAGIIALLIAALLWAPSPLRAQDAGKDDPVDASVKRGVAYLVSVQTPEGSYLDPERGNQYASVMSALAILSMASVGHQPTDKTPEGLSMRKGIDFLLRADRQRQDGYFGNTDSSRMYGHGIITLALCEMLGMGVDATQDRLLRERCQKSVELILRSQRVKKHSPRFDGGWRYTPESGDSDLSVTIWQLLSLRSAKNAGLAVPKEAIDSAVEYLKQSYKSDRDERGLPKDMKSGFAYQPGGTPEFATTAAGLLALQVCGEYNAPEVIGASDWLLDMTEGGGPRKHKVQYNQRWFFYGLYYFSQGMQKRGGVYANEAKSIVEKMLIVNQLPDGSWVSGDGQERNAGKVYSTSLAILCFAVKYHYLPIYQN